ncbi:ABC transporter permease [Brevibacillus daliensis]|uniref:ABC transporter permease n=1 Tax=Brevibacillus daliensis TaxID=2892995 RepID=UPI001E2CC3FB|nr:ABC transporter permease [Brevibacillus daliensis]
MIFLRLVQNEIMKINSKRQSILFFSLLAGLVLITAIIIKAYISDLALVMNYLQFTMLTITIFGFLITLFGLILGAQIVTDEYKDGTIKQLLIRPSSRVSILFSKYLSVLIMITAAYFFLFVWSSLLGFIFFGAGEGLASAEKIPLLEEIGNLTFTVVFQFYLTELPSLFFLATLSFFTATIFKRSALALSVAIIAYFSGKVIGGLSQNYWWGEYIVFNHLPLYAYSDSVVIQRFSSPAYPELGLSFSIIILVLYFAIMLGSSALVFSKRDVA